MFSRKYKLQMVAIFAAFDLKQRALMPPALVPKLARMGAARGSPKQARTAVRSTEVIH